MTLVDHRTDPTSPTPPRVPCAARRLGPQQRRDLALQALTDQNISALARTHTVSRKFVYQQRSKADDALTRAFAPPPPPRPEVLCQLPITRHWLRQFVLCTVLIGHTSLRGTQELLEALLGLHVSLGWVQAVVADAATTAKAINAAQDLTRVRVAALDEIFQNRQPVLCVVDVDSTYCCHLSREDHRDADTWGVRLLELARQGFAPRATVADFAKGLRAGQAQALGETPCLGDLFHACDDLGQVVRFLDNRGYQALACLDKLERQRHPDVTKLQAARAACARAVALADDVATLALWLRQDVLAVAGPCLQERGALYDFLVAELQAREELCPHRLRPARVALANRKEELLLFAGEMDLDVSSLAAQARVPEAVVRELIAVQETPPGSARRWQRDRDLRRRLGSRYHGLSAQVEVLRREVVRASSLVENLNSRLRNYFHLRREVGGEYLELLRFFLNHRRLLRSERPERVGRSPWELLSGAPHPHWLELLDHQRVEHPAA